LKYTFKKISQVHAKTLLHLQKGHHWITADELSLKFPKDALVLEYKNEKQVWTFLHDPTHQTVKARKWANFPIRVDNLDEDILSRVQTCLEKKKPFLEERSHFYIAFGEFDQLPGLRLIYLSGSVIIQLYANYWNKFIPLLTTYLTKQEIIPLKQLWIHERVQSQVKNLPKLVWGNVADTPTTTMEGGLNFKLFLGEQYDYGIYTDMTSFREIMFSSEAEWENLQVLNLFSYTGAFSLWAAAAGARVTSVDSSKSYMDVLKQNQITNDLELNQENIQADVFTFLKKCQKKFDVIIIDPPPSFTTGKKRTSCVDVYPSLLELCKPLLKKGGAFYVFLNHQQTTEKKFSILMENVFPKSQTEKLPMTGDIGPIENFPESQYLKAFKIIPL
jgi:23S rRNA (cytosine1962-C5)-methyltransferase